MSISINRFRSLSLRSNGCVLDSLRCLGSLVYNHFLVHSFKVQFLQGYAGNMLDKEASKELEAFVIPAVEHGVVLFNLFEGLDGLGSDRLHPFLCSLELLILLEG